MSSINKNSSTPLGCGMNCKINVTSVVSGANSISADISLNPTGRNIGIQPPHKAHEGCDYIPSVYDRIAGYFNPRIREGCDH